VSVPELTGDGVLLRGWRDGDAAAVAALADDEVTRRWSASLRRVASQADALDWIRDRVRRGHDWAVTDAEAGHVVGRVGLHHFDEDGRTAEIGFGVLAAYRRSGVARRAVVAATEHGFGTLALARISLEHATGNVGSCAVARACGFPPEGVKRAALPRGDGGFDDVHLHARLAADPAGPLEPGPVPIEPVEIVAGSYQLCVPNPELDAAAVAAAVDDDDIRLFNAGPATVEEAYAWCRGRADWSVGTHASWLVKDTTGVLLGAVSIFQIDHRSAGGQAGYWVARDARGQGVASAALAAAARFAFEGLGLVRVELFHAVENAASCRTALRAGFALEGTSRQSYRYGDGLLRDEHSHARLAGD
jgi:RimJ/RimL family protein N-acetyltransferase